MEGLFCGSDEPQARYALVPCADIFCSCCLPLHTYKKSQPWPIVDFTASSMHRFLNGYTTYLNCSATCTTSNIVYAMTCPCGHYDYIDSTAKTLADAMVSPVFLRVARKTTFINGIDLVRALEKYVTDGQLKPTTLFITFDVENLYTMIPRQGALEALMQFLERHLHNKKIGTLRIDDIMRMARLVLDTNIFAYENKYYRQIRGGAMGSAFTRTLANIYMLHWEQKLIQDQEADKEIYGRYIDDVFMTTNLTFDQVKKRLENAHRKDPNIRISYSIQSTIDFLDVTVSNVNGQLKTTIFHKPAAEPYILPYTSDHPRNVYHNIPYAALLRAARICSNVEDFDIERIRIDLSLLLNEYPPSFVSKHFHRFFQLNQAMPVLERLDSDVYHEIHQNLLHKPTRKEKQLQETIEDLDALPEPLQKKQLGIRMSCMQNITSKVDQD
ncbi:unnamed protein product [Rotaria sp. Silwood1]|nr:unnamed protein product [Rotaria sp. Silwood1]